MNNFFFIALYLFAFSPHLFGQQHYWQQSADYNMAIDFDVTNHRFLGDQTIIYTNYSPDTLTKIFYHLYFNAFQPGSMMDVRSRTIADPDRRVGARIAALGENEIGYQKILELKQDGKKLNYQVEGTILEVNLIRPILPNKSTKLAMKFQAQVPLQIRRSGRDNSEGIAYSMTQWYPKLCEYDREGWHANPYIAREFHGVWGNFEVNISIDSAYTVAATGYLQNPQVIGHGYEDPDKPVKRKKDAKIRWHFKAPKVHDFAWAADPNYIHTTAQVPNGAKIHFFYQPDSLTKYWQNLSFFTVKAFEILNKKFGLYPYSKYSVIQGGDGGMEYPMATLITGQRSLGSLVGVTVHEVIHSWFQMLLATNEAKYAWMDEGFTSYASSYVMNILFNQNLKNPHQGNYRAYFKIVEDGKEEPMSTHADYFITNKAYGISSYSKGAVFLNQLSYIIGQEAFEKGMLRYYYTWRYKHPTPTDFKRVMEKVSGIELDWYFENWIGTVNTIDYGIKYIAGHDERTTITLQNKGTMPMPIDVKITYQDGTSSYYYIPLRIMRGEKKEKMQNLRAIVKKDWPWTYPEYVMKINKSVKEITSIVIDPSERMADIDRKNNTYPNNENTAFSD